MGALLYRLRPAPLKDVISAKKGESIKLCAQVLQQQHIHPLAIPLDPWGCVCCALPVALHRPQARKESSRNPGPQ